MTTTSPPSPPHTRPRSWKRLWWPRLGLLAASVLVAFLTAEVALRILGLGYASTPGVGHPVFHHGYEKNFRWVQWSATGEYGGFTNYTNGEGFTMRAELPPPAQPCLIFLGDSFTAAIDVPEDRRFVTLVGSRLRLPPVNFGVAMYAPVTERLRFGCYADRLRASAVVLQLFSNDIDDDRAIAKLARRDAHGGITAIPGPDSLAFRLVRRSYVARLTRKAWLSWQFRRDMNQRGQQPYAWAPYFAKPIDQLYDEADRKLTTDNILAIRAECRKRGWPFLLLAIPDRGALKAGQPDYFYAFFQAFAQREGIQWVTPAGPSGKEKPEDLFWAIDIHMTPRGHQVVAEALAPALEKALRP